MQINTNMSALFAYRSLTNQQHHLGQAMARLSSGVRINSAADDVAGVAIADRMTTRVRSLNQVHRNANDGISLLQTADSALGNLTDILQRIREIGVQAANDSYTGTDRGSMQREVNQLLQEVSRISIDTKFNGKTLMDGTGSLGGVSGNANEQLVIDGLRGSWLRESENLIKTYYGLEGSGRELDIKLVDDAVGGNLAWVTPGYSGSTLTSLSLTVDMKDFIPPDMLTSPILIDRVIAHEMVHAVMADNMDLISMPWWFIEGTAEFIQGGDERVKGDFSNATAFVNAVPTVQPTSSLEYSSAYVAVRFLHEQTSGGIKSIMTELKKGATFDEALVATTGFTNATNFLDTYKDTAGKSYVQSLVDGGYLTNADTGAIGGADADGGVIRTATSVIPDTGGYTSDPLSGFTEKWPAGFDNTGSAGVSRNSFDLQVGEKAGERLNVSIGATTVGALGLSGINVATDPNTVIDKIDLALTYLNEQRGEMGAGLNRLGHLINVNAINIETTSDARSRILDADYAQETGELARRQIILQAGQAMLAQANAGPRQVLSLLTG